MNTRYPLLLAGTIGFALSLLLVSGVVAQQSCVPSYEGTCKGGHPPCDPTNKLKHCRDTLTRTGYTCVCRTGEDNRGVPFRRDRTIEQQHPANRMEERPQVH